MRSRGIEKVRSKNSQKPCSIGSLFADIDFLERPTGYLSETSQDHLQARGCAGPANHERHRKSPAA